MSIVIVHCKLNRFFRRACTEHGFQVEPDLDVTENVLDDLDNMFAGCAFE